MKFVWALGNYKYFHRKHFQLFWKRFAPLFQNVFMCPLKSFAYYQLYRNKSKFLDYISKSFSRKEQVELWGSYHFLGLYDTRVQFNELIWVFNLHVAPKIVYLFCLKIWECDKIVTFTRVARKILKYCYCIGRNI